MAESLGSAVLTVSVDDAQLKAGLDRAKQSAATAGRAIGQALSGGNGGQSLTGLNIKLNSLQDELQRVAIGTRRFRELREEIEKTQRTLNRAQGGGGAGALGGIASVVAGLGVGAGAIGFLRGSINAAVDLESITKKLSNTLGPQGAGQALSFTKGLSDQLGLSFKTLAGSFGSFTAAATAANVPLDQQRELFASVSRAAQALGLSNDEINGSLLALQQVAAKGTVQMEELRGQLGERLPIAFAAAARGLGITQQELIKLVESGKLTASQFFPALTKGLNELTAGAGGTETAAQNFQKLANAWDELQTSFGQSILPTVVEQVKQLTKVLEGAGVVLRANKLGLGGGAITNALGIIPDQGAEAVGALQSLQAQFSLTEKQANALFTDAVASVGGRANAFGQLTLSAEQFQNVLERLPALAETFRAKNKDVTGELNAQNAAAAKLLETQLKSVDSIANIEEKIKSLSAQRSSAEIGSPRFNDLSSEIQSLRERLNNAQGSGFALPAAFDPRSKVQGLFDKAANIDPQKPNTDSGAQAEEMLNKARQAQEEASAKVAEGFNKVRQASDALAQSQQALRSAQEGAFDLLTNSRQDALLNAARADLSQAVRAGFFDSGKVAKLNDSQLISAASQARAVLKADDALLRSQIDLVSANEALEKATTTLAEKDWNVKVDVNANSGDYAVNLG